MEKVVMRPPGFYLVNKSRIVIFHFLFTFICPGHSGKAKKGHLCFDAIYETGEELVGLEAAIKEGWTSSILYFSR